MLMRYAEHVLFVVILIIFPGNNSVFIYPTVIHAPHA